MAAIGPIEMGYLTMARAATIRANELDARGDMEGAMAEDREAQRLCELARVARRAHEGK